MRRARGGAQQLEHVRIALLRHDRRARRYVGQRVTDVGEFLGIEQQQVCSRYGSRSCVQQLRVRTTARDFCFAARQLYGRDWLPGSRRSRVSGSRQVSRSRSAGPACHNPPRCRGGLLLMRRSADSRRYRPHRRYRPRSKRRSRRSRVRPMTASPAACACSPGSSTSPWRSLSALQRVAPACRTRLASVVISVMDASR